MTQLNQNTIYFMRLVRQYLESGGKNCSAPEFAPMADLEEILRIASCNGCESFIYHTIWKWSAEYGLDDAVLQLYKQRMLFSAVSQLRADSELMEVISAFHNAGIKFLLLKGMVLSNLYPNPEYRKSTDADIHINDEYIQHAEEVLVSRGYEHIPNDALQYEKTYRLNGVLTIELHTRLFEDFYKKNREAIIALGFESHANRREIRLSGAIVETLTPNHFLTYVICHHTKHFINAGINLRHLIDICIYINEYNEQLNWDFILSALERFRIKDFALYMLYICQHHLCMVDLSFLYQDIDEEVVLMVLYDVIERNAFSDDNELKRSAARDVVRHAYFGNSSLNLVMHSIFPSAKMLSKKYAYAKNHPVLLPIAWLHRAYSYLLRKMRGQRMISPAERARIAEERVELLKRVQIL